MTPPPAHSSPSAGAPQRPLGAGLSQHQEMGLQQRLSPMMRQSLEILQAPALELRQLVQQELETNPTLEEESPDHSLDESEEQASEQDEELRELEQWDEDYREEQILSGQHLGRNREHEELQEHLYDSIASPLTLASYLQEQVATAPLVRGERQAFDILVAALDVRGYLDISLEDVALDNMLSLDDVETAYSTLLTFDPPGVGARNLADCLLIQLQRRGYATHLATTILEEHFDSFIRNRRPEIARALHTTVAEVNQAADLIATLTPRPAEPFSEDDSRTINPDMIITSDESGEFTAILNESVLPRLRVSRYYKDLLSEESSDKVTRGFVRDKIRAGKFIIQCIEQRQETLRKIAHQIIQRQQAFLESGISALRPMTMQQIADAIGVHETTVSRAINGKYTVTPHGVFELRRFFTAGFQSADGTDIANTSVKTRLAALVAAENPAKPLSDNKLSILLNEEGLTVARRTIAKYREALGIPPTNLRRKHV